MKNLLLLQAAVLALVGCADPAAFEAAGEGAQLTAFQAFSRLSAEEAREQYHRLDPVAQLALWEESWLTSLKDASDVERIALEYALEHIEELSENPERAQRELQNQVGAESFTRLFASLGPLSGPQGFASADGLAEATRLSELGMEKKQLCDHTSVCADGMNCYNNSSELNGTGPYYVVWCSSSCQQTAGGCGLFGWFGCAAVHVRTWQVDNCNDWNLF